MPNFISIIFLSFFWGFGTYAYAEFFDNSIIALENRIAPIGKVKIATSNITQPSLNKIKDAPVLLGKTIFESKCILCHKNGVAGAPRLGNKPDWAPRIKKKFSLLLKHVTMGYQAMPPKGACLECSISDLEIAIRYMLEQLPSN